MSASPPKASLRDAYGETLVELGEKDPGLVVLDADLSGSTRTALFGRKFPARFFNVGVMEPTMMTIAAGLSLALTGGGAACNLGPLRKSQARASRREPCNGLLAPDDRHEDEVRRRGGRVEAEPGSAAGEQNGNQHNRC